MQLLIQSISFIREFNFYYIANYAFLIFIYDIAVKDLKCKDIKTPIQNTKKQMQNREGFSTISHVVNKKTLTHYKGMALILYYDYL